MNDALHSFGWKGLIYMKFMYKCVMCYMFCYVNECCTDVQVIYNFLIYVLSCKYEGISKGIKLDCSE